MGMANIDALMLKLVETLLKSYGEMGQQCLKVKNKAIEPKSNNDNFSMSYEYKIIHIKNRKPTVTTFWLWKDWRDF